MKMYPILMNPILLSLSIPVTQGPKTFEARSLYNKYFKVKLN